MTLASYNTGPTQIETLRREAEHRGLDPNVWFGSVEGIALEGVGREPVQYVSSIYKYYVAYSLLMDRYLEGSRAKTQQIHGAQ